MVLKKSNTYERGKTIVYLVRHGESNHHEVKNGKKIKYPGPGLTRLGKKQARDVAKEFSKIKSEIDKLYCSGMTRAIETADEIGKAIKKKPIQIKELSELNNILWHGGAHKINFWKYYFRYRKAKKAFDNILMKNKEKVLVFVVHGEIIRAIFGHKFKLSFKNRGRFDSNNCYITKLRFKRNNKIDWVYCVNRKGFI